MHHLQLSKLSRLKHMHALCDDTPPCLHLCNIGYKIPNLTMPQNFVRHVAQMRARWSVMTLFMHVLEARVRFAVMHILRLCLACAQKQAAA